MPGQLKYNIIIKTVNELNIKYEEKKCIILKWWEIYFNSGVGNL